MWCLLRAVAGEPGPRHVARQQQASKAVSQAVRAEGQRRVTPGQAPQGMLTLQEDEVDWGSEASDPALQHALAVIQAKGNRMQLTQQMQALVSYQWMQDIVVMHSWHLTC